MTILPRLRCFSLLQQGGLSVMNQLKQIHAQIVINGLNCHQARPSLMGKLVELCCGVSASGGISHARLILNHSDKQNVYLWNVLFRCAPTDEAIRLFAEAITKGDLLLDEFTYIFMLGACARSFSSMALLEGKQIHARMLKTGYASDIVVQTTCIHFYASCGDCDSARQVFDEMPHRSSTTWNAMISGYVSQGRRYKDYPVKALMLFREMLLLVKPTETTMVSVLAACSRLGDLATGSCRHGLIVKTMLTPEPEDHDVFIGTGLVDMYSKCGCLSSALNVFKRMKVKNVLTWTSMITGLAFHGQAREALQLFHVMQEAKIKPNAATFTSLLSACCHAGLVDEGLDLFHSMSGKFDITPQIQHYGCIVDLFGRAGLLQEAYEFIIKMPGEGDDILWRSLLGACKIHQDTVIGEKVGKLLIQQQEKQQGIVSILVKESPASVCEDFIALSNVYALAEKWEDVEMVRKKMKVEGIQTKAGCSSIQLL